MFRCSTYGSMLTGVTSLIADRTGGVMSQLSAGGGAQKVDWGVLITRVSCYS